MVMAFSSCIFFIRENPPNPCHLRSIPFLPEKVLDGGVL